MENAVFDSDLFLPLEFPHSIDNHSPHTVVLLMKIATMTFMLSVTMKAMGTLVLEFATLATRMLQSVLEVRVLNHWCSCLL